MTELEEVGESHEVLKPWTDIGVQWATKYYIRMDNTDAYVITMCKSFNERITALTTNFVFQSSILPYASLGSKAYGAASLSRKQRMSF